MSLFIQVIPCFGHQPVRSFNDSWLRNEICVCRRNEALLDKFACVILDDIGYVQQNRDEMEVLFTFLAERYERKSVMITTNLVFSEWERIFKDPMTTMAAIDRLVHHSVILDMMSVESYRAEAANQQHLPSTRPEKPSSRRSTQDSTVSSLQHLDASTSTQNDLG